MYVQLTEALAERDLLFGRHRFLFAKEHHRVAKKGVADLVPLLVVEWLRQVDPANLRANDGRDRCGLNRLVDHARPHDINFWASLQNRSTSSSAGSSFAIAADWPAHACI